MAAASACHGDNGLQPLCGVLHKLLLEDSLPGGIGPCELLIQVEQAVERHGQSDQPPAN